MIVFLLKTPNESEDESPTQSLDNRTESRESQSNGSRNPIYDKIVQKPERIQRLTLRISPELFEPKLLLNPPPTALEMLQKIRDLISIAKLRLRNFRFRPSLVVIPEDDYFYNDNLRNTCGNVTLAQESRVDFPVDESQEDQVSGSTHDLVIKVEERSESHRHINDSDSKEAKQASISDDPTIKMLDYSSESSSKSVSRKKIINDVEIQFFNDLNYDTKLSDSPEKPMAGKNVDLGSELSDDTAISPVINSDLEKHLSSKVEQSFYKSLEHQLFDGKKSCESNDNRMISYFKNSLGKLSSKSKTKSDQVLISSNNWTLQTVSADRRGRQRHMNSKSVIRKRMATRRGQLCYNCSDVSSLSQTQMPNSSGDFDPKTSLESNENNEAIDSLEFYTNSDSEVSTTSSTVRDNPFTSLESEVNDTLDHQKSQSDVNGDDNSPIDECLKYLAAASVDTNAKNHDKYYSRIGRASKGMSAIKKLRSSEWNHVCHRSDSELEISEVRSDSKNFYSKNSKSRTKSSKSLNSHNRQKFKKQLALYKCQSNEALNRSGVTDEDIFNRIEQSLNKVERVINGSQTDSKVVDIKIIEEKREDIDCQPEGDLSAHFVVKIKI